MQTFSRNVFTQKKKKNIHIRVIVKGFSDPLHIKLGSMWHANQQINLCSTLTLTCITSHSSYLSTTHNFPAFKCCVKHIKLLHSFSREIRWIMIQQKLFWRGWMSVCEECLDTKAWRKACSTKWVGFHTYKQSQYPKLKVWRWSVSWCHHRCCWIEEGWNQTKGQVWIGERGTWKDCRQGIRASFVPLRISRLFPDTLCGV